MESSSEQRPNCGICGILWQFFRSIWCFGNNRRNSVDSSCYQQLNVAETGSDKQRNDCGVYSTDEDASDNDETEEIGLLNEQMKDAISQYVEREAKEFANGNKRSDTGFRHRCSIFKNHIFLRLASFLTVAGEATEGLINFIPWHQNFSGPDVAITDELSRTHRTYSVGSKTTFMKKLLKKKLRTREPERRENAALLDDASFGTAEAFLKRADDWDFNTFMFDRAAGGRSLPLFCTYLFEKYDLIRHFNFDVTDVWKFFSTIEGYYHANPYHNAVHAVDVTQAIHCYLQELKVKVFLSPVEILACLISAVCHDLDHPGFTQSFLISTSNHLAKIFRNGPILENHHWRSAICCLKESPLAKKLSDEIMTELCQLIKTFIMSTDITRQSEFLHKFRQLNKGEIDLTVRSNRIFILQMALKCADISNPCRIWKISKRWSEKVCDEFFRQGDFEFLLKLDVTYFCDRIKTCIPIVQAGFFRYVVTPLFEEWDRFMKSNLSGRMMVNLKFNHAQWQDMCVCFRMSIDQIGALILPTSADPNFLEFRRISEPVNPSEKIKMKKRSNSFPTTGPNGERTLVPLSSLPLDQISKFLEQLAEKRNKVFIENCKKLGRVVSAKVLDSGNMFNFIYNSIEQAVETELNQQEASENEQKTKAEKSDPEENNNENPERYQGLRGGSKDTDNENEFFDTDDLKDFCKKDDHDDNAGSGCGLTVAGSSSVVDDDLDDELKNSSSNSRYHNRFDQNMWMNTEHIIGRLYSCGSFSSSNYTENINNEQYQVPNEIPELSTFLRTFKQAIMVETSSETTLLHDDLNLSSAVDIPKLPTGEKLPIMEAKKQITTFEKNVDTLNQLIEKMEQTKSLTFAKKLCKEEGEVPEKFQQMQRPESEFRDFKICKRSSLPNDSLYPAIDEIQKNTLVADVKAIPVSVSTSQDQEMLDNFCDADCRAIRKTSRI